MATFLRNLRKSGSTDELAELQQLATRLESRFAALTELVSHADRSIGQLQRLSGLGERVNTLERQLTAVEQVMGRLTAAESQLEKLGGGYVRLEGQLAESVAGVARTRGEIADLQGSLAEANRIKEDAAEVLTLQEPLRQLRGDFDALQGLGETHRAELARLREQHEATISQYRTAATRIQQFDEEWQRVTRTLNETGHRIAGLEQLLVDFSPAAETIATVRRELATTRATADQLVQKVALLDQQREMIDRASAKLEHLTTLMQRADAGLERHAELERMLTEVRRQVEAASAGQGGLQERTRSLAEQLLQLESAQVQAERGLMLVRDALEQNAERIATDGRSADGINQRVGELRQSLAESEARLVTLTTNTQAISGAAAKAEVLVTQVHQLTIGLQQITDLGGRVGAGLSDLEHMEEVLVGLTERTCRLEESRPLLTETVRDLGSLSATREAIRESLEQLRVARQELSTAHGTVENTRGWLNETERSVAGLRGDVASLDRMRTTLDAVRQEVDQINASMVVVESRRTMVEEVQHRLSDAATLGASIESRATGLQQRLEAAEDHLGTLVPRLDEVGRAGGQLLQLGADLRDMESRITQVQGSLGGMETRAQGLEELTERMRGLSREIDQRQNALQRATEHLERATTLREEAAAAAAMLADQARAMDATLVRSGDRMASLDELAQQLDGRAAALATVLDRVTGFEAKLAEWHGVEQQLAMALDQAAGRQVAMSALTGEIRALHQVAERAQDDARAVVEAQPQLARARAELEGVLTRLRDTDGLARSLEERRRQVDRVEERLSQATVLEADVRASLETLLAQKAQVDHFLEKAMSLGLEARQAEGVLQALRDERRVSDRVRSALAGLHARTEEE
ncbi:MAG: hypothetical protein ABI587_11095 [Gemmatimonadales bacterium]